ncbi:MAG: 6-carboxytetrahydropterin synthase [Bacteroidales bacterium]|nr:6-carboxytetrahydropterin synthase [Bacteroidales bacterium]
MSVIRITKEFRYEGAHALYNYDGKCRNIHGHSYVLYVTVKGTPINDESNCKNGMILDFSDFKRIVNDTIVEQFDHALVLRSEAPLARELGGAYEKVVLVDFQPTCENMIQYFASVIKSRLPKNVELFSLKLHESPSSFVEWFADDNR